MDLASPERDDANPSARGQGRRCLLWLLLALLILAFALRRDEVLAILRTLVGGHPGWLLAAAVLQIAYFVLIAEVYRAGFRIVGVSSRLKELVPVQFASRAIGFSVPAGPAGPAALFIDYAVRHGQSGGRAAVAAVLVFVGDMAGLAVLLVGGAAYLASRGQLQAYQVVTAGVLLAFILTIIMLMVMGARRPRRLQRRLYAFQRLVARVMGWVHRPGLPDDWAQNTTVELAEGSLALARDKRGLAYALLIALLAHVCHAAVLAALFLAYGNPVSLGVVVAAYTMGTLFWLVAITPQGVGVVEGVMTLVLASLGVPLPIATVVSIAYRALALYLPVLVGILALRSLRN